ncbi:hypothetical protein CEUSTIGMA_g5197.t1 [Chlamydomonas eustigma]|uniref:FAD/NAD(P)-binding domain-containing protein n=1 Tax=Chlamydomonas eustigma TaxID=1157962 RepID=A0A250X3U6_9CHLO|nr:hypothetical protein CEUSTIGMA_g5197.t1 [Chlamydomonas eustigma]|eukprot:GAX77754.1 hypothetical protein CEUSTIGMA_g5197.t1 [Chlamydomonas eustigma]
MRNAGLNFNLISFRIQSREFFKELAGLVSPARSFSAESFPAVQSGRPRLVVLGTGWAAARLLKDVDPKKYDLTVMSHYRRFLGYSHPIKPMKCNLPASSCHCSDCT